MVTYPKPQQRKKEESEMGGRWVLLIVRGSTTTLPLGAFSDYVTFSTRVEMPALVVGLSL